MTSLDPYPWRTRHEPIVGLDEVGRGCLAGPVVAAAVLLEPDFELSGLTDSKLLSEMRRETLAESLLSSVQYGVGVASVHEIERHNILRASLLAMRRALGKLNFRARKPVLLVDGTFKVPGVPDDWEQVTLVKGELRAEPIAAASVIAKVVRDRFMVSLAEKFPIYGFEQNKGYGTLPHRKALKSHGPCAYHRKEFAGVREYWPASLSSHEGMDLGI